MCQTRVRQINRPPGGLHQVRPPPPGLGLGPGDQGHRVLPDEAGHRLDTFCDTGGDLRGPGGGRRGSDRHAGSVVSGNTVHLLYFATAVSMSNLDQI